MVKTKRNRTTNELDTSVSSSYACISLRIVAKRLEEAEMSLGETMETGGVGAMGGGGSEGAKEGGEDEGRAIGEG